MSFWLIPLAVAWYFSIEYVRGRPRTPRRVSKVLSWLSILGAIGLLICALVFRLQKRN